jgi:DNA-binding NtrC family response regulator
MDSTASFAEGGLPSAREVTTAPQLTLAMQADRLSCPPFTLALVDVDAVTFGRGLGWTVSRPRAGEVYVTLPDARMSRVHARLVRERQLWFAEDAGAKNGTQVNGRAIERQLLRSGDVLATGSCFWVLRDVDEERDRSARTAAADPDVQLPSALVTQSPSLGRVVARLARVAPTRLPILLEGETGTGKELCARAIHTLSGRSGPFIAVNCGAIPDELVEATLFGARKGAYTGAVEHRQGLLHAADGGTLFLDEIAELPQRSQTALLRAVQEGEVLPVGSTRAIPVDVRYLAATHQDLVARRADGRFRDDLYARLAAVTARLPALRERKEDLGLLVASLLDRAGATTRSRPVRLQRAAAQALFDYPWPLNIRELDHALRTALALAVDDEIREEHLPDDVRARAEPEPAASLPPAVLERRLREALERTGGNLSAAGRHLGKHRTQVRRWMEMFAIGPEDYRYRRVPRS